MSLSALRAEIEALTFDADKIVKDKDWERWSGTELLETKDALRALDKAKKQEERRLSDLSSRLWDAEKKLQNWESMGDILTVRQAMREIQQALEAPL